ncbi:hypothetical protein BH24DEI2_BH24DEI2_18150 [soil metagenome]
MRSERLILRGVIYLLLLITFFLGLPTFHYTVALMVALLLRHRNNPAALFTPIDSYPLPTWGVQVRPLLARVRHTPKR